MFEEVDLVRKASRRLVREWGLLRGPDGRVTLTQCHALIELDRNGVLTVADLADLLKLDKSTVSRLAAKLLERKLVAIKENFEDRRQKPLVLTPSGKKALEKLDHSANHQVQSALETVGAEERSAILMGLELYVKALSRAKIHERLEIREIRPEDNTAMAEIIRCVIAEFGIAGPGSGDNDPELRNLFEAYRGDDRAFFVVLLDGVLMGGGGFAPLKDGKDGVCELQRMYFQPGLRGTGAGTRLLSLCLERARAAGYHNSYLETHHSMHRAQRLYEQFGFKRQIASEGNTGHCACNTYYIKSLKSKA